MDDKEKLLEVEKKDDDEPLDEHWKRRRLTTFIVYTLLYFNTGFEQPLIVTTSWTYVSTQIDTDQKNLIYTLINTVSYFPSLILTGLLASYGDRTRNIKTVIILTNISYLIGAISYMIPYSVYFPLIGQLLAGVLLLQRPLMVGEITRSYSKNKLQLKYCFFTASYGVGTALGPCVAFMITNVDFYIFGLHMTYGNTPGLIRAILIVVTLILTILYVHDLSKEYDYKSDVQNLDAVKEKDGFILIKVVKQIDILFIVFASFVINVLEATLYVFYPVYIIETSNLSKSIVDLCYILPLLVYPILTLIMLKTTKNGGVYHLGIIGWILLFLIGCALVAINPICKPWINIIVLFSLNFVLQIFAYIMLMFVTVTLSNLVQFKHQSVFDSLRCICRQSGAIVGSLIGGFGTADGKMYIEYGFIIASIVMLALTILRRKNIKNTIILL